MANKEIVIDVVSEYSDHASSGLQQTGKNAEKASREMDKLGKKRAKPKLGLEDKASPVQSSTSLVKRETGSVKRPGLQNLD